jgi:hypothetical protein
VWKYVCWPVYGAVIGLIGTIVVGRVCWDFLDHVYVDWMPTFVVLYGGAVGAGCGLIAAAAVTVWRRRAAHDEPKGAR